MIDMAVTEFSGGTGAFVGAHGSTEDTGGADLHREPTAGGLRGENVFSVVIVRGSGTELNGDVRSDGDGSQPCERVTSVEMDNPEPARQVPSAVFRIRPLRASGLAAHSPPEYRTGIPQRDSGDESAGTGTSATYPPASGIPATRRTGCPPLLNVRHVLRHFSLGGLRPDR
jgi:hypothetical protein